MKRALLQNVKVQPYTAGDALDREGFLSAIIGAKTSGTTLKLTVTHSDDGNTFEAINDIRVFPEKNTTDGVYEHNGLEANSIVNVDIDLVGCKKFIKIASTGASALAVALGDAAVMPV